MIAWKTVACRISRRSDNDIMVHTTYRVVIKRVLLFSIPVWYDNTRWKQKTQLDLVVCVASTAICYDLPPVGTIYTRGSPRRSHKTVANTFHPFNALFCLMPSGVRYRHVRDKSSKLKKKFLYIASV